MPRKTAQVLITKAGRDFGKKFEIKEMPSDQFERWANRALIAFANASGKLPDGVLGGGAIALEFSWRNILVMGVQAIQGLSYHEIGPLLEEMVPCFKWRPPGNAPLQQIFPGEDSQIDELSTWHTLRIEWLQLHLGFSVTDISMTSESTPETQSVL